MDLALKVLAAFFASAALLLLGSIGAVLTSKVLPQFQTLAAQPQQAVIIGLILALGLVLSVVYSLCAWFIWKRMKWNFLLLLAIIACFGFPVGPFLGIAAIILLTRPAVRAQFRD